MIVEAVITVTMWLVKGLIATMPTAGPPGWLDDGAGYLNTLMESAAGLGAFIPWGLAVTVIMAVLACVVVGFVIKVVRIIASFFTLGGGSAA